MSLRPFQIDFPEVWNRLHKTIQDVMALDRISWDAWKESFNDVFLLCVARPVNFADELYKRTKIFLVNHAHKLFNIIQNGDTSNLLQDYYTHWQKYSKGIKHLHSLFLYLNNLLINRLEFMLKEFGKSAMSNVIEYLVIEEMGLDVWKRYMIVPLQDCLQKSLLDEFDKHRYDICTTTSLDVIAGVINSFVVVDEFRHSYPLEIYETCFERSFLTNISEHFKREAAKLLQECTVSEYMVKVLQKLKKEEICTFKCVRASTFKKIRKRFHQHIVSDHLDILHGEFEAMLREERKNDMRNIYLLLREVKDGLNTLVATFSDHVKQYGIRVVESLKPEQVFIHFVEEVLAVHTKYKSMVVDVFQNDLSFNHALDKAFTVIVNYKQVINQSSKSPEYLSKYCDNLLKKSSRGICETEIDQKLLQSVTIFRYIDDKDLFQKFYQRHLAKRLIHQQSQSMDGEEGMINNLKLLCGYEFASKMHKMFTDIRVSEDLITKFHSEFLQPANKLDITFSIYVLQTGAWPLQSLTVSSFNIPKQLIPYVQNFEEFYNAKFNGRKLKWLYNHCQGVLKLNYLKKVYVVTMQTFQIAIMLLFENQDEFKLSEIREMLQLDNDQFKKHINSLVDCKLLLVKDDTVSLNMNYTNKRTKLCITTALQKDTPEEIEQTVTVTVENDRKNFLQATIVRIMKARNVLSHHELVNEILSHSKSFSPSITLIKKTIEILIAKKYLVHTPNSTDGYSYVA